MAKVSLRLYNREIENLIENGQVEEAIAHCIYILHSYPKHIETYRLLGKALLESQKFEEASDIFQRVLVAIPDDFISHVGMSILRENDGDLDNAIWHMERAFEVQPSNNVVKDELRRLYERRDGVKLARIRMTRGALARMYAKGDLYQQAVAEIRAILANEPNRPDLQVLLARMCFQVGQRIETTEICSELLSKYPYCYEANRLLAQILPNTSRSEDTKIYLQRISALDPYAAFQNPGSATSKDVPENTVLLERYAYQPSLGVENESQPLPEGYLSAMQGTNLGEESLPDWLKGFEKATPTEETAGAYSEPTFTTAPTNPQVSETVSTATPSPETTSSSRDILPDWLKAFDLAPSETHEKGQESPEEISPLASAELPDWLRQLKAQAPAEVAENQEPGQVEQNVVAPISPISTEGEVPGWIKELEPTPPQETPVESLQPAGDVAPSSITIQGIASEAPAQPEIEIPEWLQELGSRPASLENAPIDQPSGKLPGIEPTEEVPTTPSVIPSEVAPSAPFSNERIKTLSSQAFPEEIIPIQPAEDIKLVQPATEPNQVPELSEQEAPLPPSQTVQVTDAAEELPDWLQNILSTSPVEPIGASQAAEPTAPPEAQAEPVPSEIPEAVTAQVAQTEAVPFGITGVFTPQVANTEDQPSAVSDLVPPQEAQEEIPPAIIPGSSMPEAILQPFSGFQDILTASQAALQAGNFDEALSGYDQLIKQGVHVGETIHDLSESLNRAPKNSAAWQILGDAFIHSNRIEEALDAYAKAEEYFQ